jgi:uroporphyrinogen-III synthase
MTNPTIVNTRPKNLQLESNQAFIEAGFDVVELPCIEIVESDSSHVRSHLESIKENDIVIFTSQFAVHFAFKLFPNLKFNDSNVLITVGSKTAEVLEQNSTVAIWIPEKQNSEGVIELLRGLRKIQKIVLISAAQGRQEIQSYAKLNNISMQQINVYKRIVPDVDCETLDRLDGLSEFQTLATSATTIANLKKILPERQWQKTLKNNLICASERIAMKAIDMGFEKVINANSAYVEKMILAIKKANA